MIFDDFYVTRSVELVSDEILLTSQVYLAIYKKRSIFQLFHMQF